MENRLEEILGKIEALEEELKTEIEARRSQFSYKVEGARAVFEAQVAASHRKMKVGLLRWLVKSRPLHMVTSPFIYALIVPLALTDLFVSLYQAVCFPVYRIPKVKREKYIVVDRHRLEYLNTLEKINCVYCGYSNGLLAYVREIASRTEQYWCPIKHARKSEGTHSRYPRFIDYGDPEAYAARLKRLRKALEKEQGSEKPGD